MMYYKPQTALALMAAVVISFPWAHAMEMTVSSPNQSASIAQNARIDQLLIITDKLTNEIEELKENMPARTEFGVAEGSGIVTFGTPFETPPRVYFSPFTLYADGFGCMQDFVGFAGQASTVTNITATGFKVNFGTMGACYNAKEGVYKVNWAAVEDKHPDSIAPAPVPFVYTAPRREDDGGSFN